MTPLQLTLHLLSLFGQMTHTHREYHIQFMKGLSSVTHFHFYFVTFLWDISGCALVFWISNKDYILKNCKDAFPLHKARVQRCLRSWNWSLHFALVALWGCLLCFSRNSEYLLSLELLPVGPPLACWVTFVIVPQMLATSVSFVYPFILQAPSLW